MNDAKCKCDPSYNHHNQNCVEVKQLVRGMVSQYESLPFLNSATKEAYGAGYQAAKEKYERYAAIWKMGARIGYGLAEFRDQERRKLAVENICLNREIEQETKRVERYRRRAFAMRRALVRFRTAVLNDACDACFCWFKNGRRVLFGRL